MSEQTVDDPFAGIAEEVGVRPEDVAAVIARWHPRFPYLTAREIEFLRYVLRIVEMDEATDETCNNVEQKLAAMALVASPEPPDEIV